MPADLDHLAHFSISSAMSLPKSAGETTSGVPPKSASRALILGSARPALISPLSFSTISAGRGLRCADAEPGARLVARHKLTGGRDVGQHVRLGRGGYRER